MVLEQLDLRIHPPTITKEVEYPLSVRSNGYFEPSSLREYEDPIPYNIEPEHEQSMRSTPTDNRKKSINALVPHKPVRRKSSKSAISKKAQGKPSKRNASTPWNDRFHISTQEQPKALSKFEETRILRLDDDYDTFKCSSRNRIHQGIASSNTRMQSSLSSNRFQSEKLENGKYNEQKRNLKKLQQSQYAQDHKRQTEHKIATQIRNNVDLQKVLAGLKESFLHDDNKCILDEAELQVSAPSHRSAQHSAIKVGKKKYIRDKQKVGARHPTQRDVPVSLRSERYFSDFSSQKKGVRSPAPAMAPKRKALAKFNPDHKPTSAGIHRQSSTQRLKSTKPPHQQKISFNKQFRTGNSKISFRDSISSRHYVKPSCDSSQCEPSFQQYHAERHGSLPSYLQPSTRQATGTEILDSKQHQYHPLTTIGLKREHSRRHNASKYVSCGVQVESLTQIEDSFKSKPQVAVKAIKNMVSPQRDVKSPASLRTQFNAANILDKTSSTQQVPVPQALSHSQKSYRNESLQSEGSASIEHNNAAGLYDATEYNQTAGRNERSHIDTTSEWASFLQEALQSISSVLDEPDINSDLSQSDIAAHDAIRSQEIPQYRYSKVLNELEAVINAEFGVHSKINKPSDLGNLSKPFTSEDFGVHSNCKQGWHQSPDKGMSKPFEANTAKIHYRMEPASWDDGSIHDISSLQPPATEIKYKRGVGVNSPFSPFPTKSSNGDVCITHNAITYGKSSVGRVSDLQKTSYNNPCLQQLQAQPVSQSSSSLTYKIGLSNSINEDQIDRLHRYQQSVKRLQPGPPMHIISSSVDDIVEEIFASIMNETEEAIHFTASRWLDEEIWSHHNDKDEEIPSGIPACHNGSHLRMEDRATTEERSSTLQNYPVKDSQTLERSCHEGSYADDFKSEATKDNTTTFKNDSHILLNAGCYSKEIFGHSYEKPSEMIAKIPEAEERDTRRLTNPQQNQGESYTCDQQESARGLNSTEQDPKISLTFNSNTADAMSSPTPSISTTSSANISEHMYTQQKLHQFPCDTNQGVFDDNQISHGSKYENNEDYDKQGGTISNTNGLNSNGAISEKKSQTTELQPDQKNLPTGDETVYTDSFESDTEHIESEITSTVKEASSPEFSEIETSFNREFVLATAADLSSVSSSS